MIKSYTITPTKSARVSLSYHSFFHVLFLYFFACGAAWGAGMEPLSEPKNYLLKDPLFYVHYQLPKKQQGRLRPPMPCWVAANVTLGMAERVLDEESMNQGGGLYVLTSSGVLCKLGRVYWYKQTTFAKLAAGPYSKELSNNSQRLQAENAHLFLVPRVFEQKIAHCYALIKPGGRHCLVPVNTLVRSQQSRVYRKGECLKTRFYYNRAITDKRLLQMMLLRTIQPDEHKKVYSPAQLVLNQGPPRFVWAIDWDPHTGKLVWHYIALKIAPAPGLAQQKDQKTRERTQGHELPRPYQMTSSLYKHATSPQVSIAALSAVAFCCGFWARGRSKVTRG